MDFVTLKLKDFSQAPWGLFTDEFPPQPLVWLTEVNSNAKIARAALTDTDIKNIWSGQCTGVITSEGLFLEEKKEESVQDTAQSKIFDVSELMRQEDQQTARKKQFLENKYPNLDEILALPASKLKKKLKEMAKSATVPFFQEAKRREEGNKDRKTVIAVLVEIIQKKVTAVGLVGSVNAVTGESMVADTYYDMIEEFEDEDEDVEIKEPISRSPKSEVPDEIVQRFSERAQS